MFQSQLVWMIETRRRDQLPQRLTVSRWELATRTDLSLTTMARWRRRSWLVTPVGQWPVWHCCA
jgi:hypothetical protein